MFHSGLLLSLLLLSVLANASYGSPPPPPTCRQMFSLPVVIARLLLFGGAGVRYCAETPSEGAASTQREEENKLEYSNRNIEICQ